MAIVLHSKATPDVEIPDIATWEMRDITDMLNHIQMESRELDEKHR